MKQPRIKSANTFFAIVAIDYSSGPEQPLYCLQCQFTQVRVVKSAAEVRADARLFEQLAPEAQAVIKLGLDLPQGRLLTCS